MKIQLLIITILFALLGFSNCTKEVYECSAETDGGLMGTLILEAWETSQAQDDCEDFFEISEEEGGCSCSRTIEA